jgi:hypothetical protein
MHSFVDAMHMQGSGLVFIMGSQKAGLGLPIMLSPVPMPASLYCAT